MNLLLDTHIALWVFSDNPKLSLQARALIEDEKNTSYVSVVSAWEIAIKHVSYPDEITQPGNVFLLAATKVGLEQLPLEAKHIEVFDALDFNRAGALHKDPFDRMLIAQAKAESMLLLTHDKALAVYNEPLVQIV